MFLCDRHFLREWYNKNIIIRYYFITYYYFAIRLFPSPLLSDEVGGLFIIS